MAVNFKRAEKRIEFEGGDITVRGLTFPEIAQLVESHKETAQKLFGRFVKTDLNAVSDVDATKVGMDVLAVAPGFVAHVVALGADAANEFDLIATLPIDVQLAAIEQIALMTFAIAGGSKNFGEMVLRMATGTSHLVGNLREARN